MEAIVLAGGFGKRLQSKIKNIPKPMAPINEKPFLDYIFRFLIRNKIKKVILSVFYEYQKIIDHYGNKYKSLEIIYSIDKKELGTGGAIKNALFLCNSDNVFILNGDTYFDVDLNSLYKEHIKNNYDITLSLKPMRKINRYGLVETNTFMQVVSFQSNKYSNYGTIDGGIYLIKNNLFKSKKNDKKFSFNNYIEQSLESLKIGSLVCNSVFIDIGIPKDYDKAHNILLDK